MKFIAPLAALAALTAAIPVAQPVTDVNKIADIDRRQNVGTTATEFTTGGCRDVIWFFARGSTEVGNMGLIVGPPTANALKAELGSSRVAVEGINYPALLSGNFLPGGADPGGIREAQRLLTLAAAQCPNSSILAGGYSQGAALMHRAIESLPQNVKDAIDGVVTFGDTKNQQDNGQIPNFPREKVRIFCDPGDNVCWGGLLILPAHLSYGSDADEAAAFLAARARAGGA